MHQITLLLQLLLSKLVTTVIYHLFLESNITHSFLILISLLVFSMIIRNNNLYSDSVFKEEYPNTFTIIILLLFDRRNIPSNFVCPVLLQRFYLYPFCFLHFLLDIPKITATFIHQNKNVQIFLFETLL